MNHIQVPEEDLLFPVSLVLGAAVVVHRLDGELHELAAHAALAHAVVHRQHRNVATHRVGGAVRVLLAHDAADDALVATGMAQLPDVMLTNVFGFLGRDIIRSCAICRKWRHLCTVGLDTTNLVPMSVLEEQEGNNPLRVRGAPHYAGRVVLRNDLYACWRAVSPSDLATWEIVPKAARRFILTHASLHEIFAGPG